VASLIDKGIAREGTLTDREVADLMQLKLDAVVNGETAVVTCRGRILYGSTARRFRLRIGRMLRRSRRVVLQLANVTDIDARGVGMLAVLMAQAKSTDRQLVVGKSSARVQRILHITGLDVQLHEDGIQQLDCRSGP
jgi:anti-anti-sigma factor